MKIVFFFIALASANADYYDTLSGERISESTYKARRNISDMCVTTAAPCKEDEFRRIDGTCNNFLYPSYGAIYTPWRRLLSPYPHKATEPRETSDGRPLPLSRVAATTLLSKGRVPSTEITNLVPNYWLLTLVDMVFPLDTGNYVRYKPYCCKSEGKYDDLCAPNIIPPDDPVHRFSNIRCQNMIKPESFQTHGCIAKNTSIIRGTQGTPALDLSFVYGSTTKDLNEKGRAFTGGLLKSQLINGYEWPLSMEDDNPWKFICMNNVGNEIRTCLNTRKQTEIILLAAELGVNALLGSLTMSVLYWRQHNRLARELASYNPCWDDEMLFHKARDINIALHLQIFYYELMPSIIGRENLIRDGVIQEYSGFRDVYDETLYPQTSLESIYALRWVHLIQEGSLKLYDRNGYYSKRFPIVNATLRPGWFATGDNFAQVLQGSFRQPSAAIDYVVDPDISDVGLGPLQKMHDIILNDHAKGAHFEFQPYIKYREYCSGKQITCFDDLRDVIDEERIELLKDLYENVGDIELMSGLWVERPKEGSKVPDTLYCMIVEQLLHNLRSDRHWYERDSRPNAFTYDQLQEIRKASIGRLLCKTGDFVTQIQPNPFLKAGPGNAIDDCDITTQNIRMSVFKDPSCNLK
ncbi:peroxidase-like [Hyposmocoma kahamanoa]|uniref:peroxidase-like n=1 Tax=Hyposmocoma kahamanoa TaxID=1477025 RepID=UPI000E6D8B5A|nr:peroxidase-like [Hyposmocoma kahamanoa]